MEDRLMCTWYLLKYLVFMQLSKAVIIVTRRRPRGLMLNAFNAFENMYRIMLRHGAGTDMFRAFTNEWDKME